MCSPTCLDWLKQWRLWMGPLFILAYAMAALILVPVLLTKSLEDGFDRHDQEILIGGVFVLVALPISLWEIIMHIIHYTTPKLQKPIIRVLWMVPIYALNAWLGLIYPRQSVYIDSLRECYEAYVIYNFMKYLLNYLNMSLEDLGANLEVKPQVEHIFPLCCLPNWTMGWEFVHICKHGILQYTVVRPVTTLISFICKQFNVYGEGQFHGNVAFPYMMAFNNASQFIAMYCLVMFYRANQLELRPMKPLPKFLCIKAVVFFSFFQGVLIAFLVYMGIITSSEKDDDGLTLSAKLQDFLICIEMCLAAIAHRYSFSYKPYVRPGTRNESMFNAFLAMWDISDVHRDIQEHLWILSGSISRKIRGKGMYAVPAETYKSDYLASTSTTEESLPMTLFRSTSEKSDVPDVYVSGYGSISPSQEHLFSKTDGKNT